MIARTLTTKYTCDRCGHEESHDFYTSPIFYGDPSMLKDNFVLPYVNLPNLSTEKPWAEFFGSHFCGNCAVIVKPIFLEARTKSVEKPK